MIFKSQNWGTLLSYTFLRPISRFQSLDCNLPNHQFHGLHAKFKKKADQLFLISYIKFGYINLIWNQAPKDKIYTKSDSRCTRNTSYAENRFQPRIPGYEELSDAMPVRTA